MTDIKFARDYGYAPGAPFWLTWDGVEDPKRHASREEAEASAAQEVSDLPGYKPVHVLCCMSTLTTDVQVIGTRFDPSRSPLTEVVDEAPPPPPAPVLLSDEDQVAF